MSVSTKVHRSAAEYIDFTLKSQFLNAHVIKYNSTIGPRTYVD